VALKDYHSAYIYIYKKHSCYYSQYFHYPFQGKTNQETCYTTKTNSTYKWQDVTLNAARFSISSSFFLVAAAALSSLLSLLSMPLLLLPRYPSIALRIYLLLAISPRLLSIFCILDLGKVIPSLIVISIVATIVLLVILVECTMLEKKGNDASPSSFPGSTEGTLVTLSPEFYNTTEYGSKIPSGFTFSRSGDCGGT
jgi:hypothetical protein